METRSSGIGLFTVIGVVFVILKLTGVSVIATWSWWLILLPFYGPVVGVVIFLLLVALVAAAFK